MGVSEAGTLAALEDASPRTSRWKIAEPRDGCVKLTGDGMLVEFPALVNAVRPFAVENSVQDDPAKRQRAAGSAVRISYRRKPGDIIFEDNDIFGDGVTLRGARIERHRQAGGVLRFQFRTRPMYGKPAGPRFLRTWVSKVKETSTGGCASTTSPLVRRFPRPATAPRRQQRTNHQFAVLPFTT